MSNDLVEAVRTVVGAGGDADDVLRRTVSTLAADPRVAWAGIAFVEGDTLVLGPEAGTPDAARRTTVAIRYRAATVAELRIDGDLPQSTLDDVAELVADHCLVGWDTDGRPWGADA